MKKTHLAILFLVFLGLAAAYGVRKYNQRDPVFTSGQVGKIAPDFTLASATEGEIKLADYKGKLVLLNFWASWCPPCRAEIPGFIKIQEEYKDKGFTILGAAIEDKEAVNRYMKDVGLNYPTAYGVEAVHKVAGDYGDPDGALPYSVLISKDQKILAVFPGFLSEAKLKKLIEDNK